MTKIVTASLIIVFSSLAPASQALRLGLECDFINESDGSMAGGFRGEMLIPQAGNREVFIPPYSITIETNRLESGQYELKLSFSGLGPSFPKFGRKLEIGVGEKLLISGLPVKDDVVINYGISLLDDTGEIEERFADLEDTTGWGTSVSIHYSTRWQRNSFADYAWNRKMGYLENIYDRHRNSFRLSMSQRIEMVFYPEPTDDVYLDQRVYYAVHPNSGRIDLVFGHEVDAASPAPGAELLIYRLWGFGPRWMVSGLARYYNDNHLKLSMFADRLAGSELVDRIAADDWVVSDTGSIFCGGFVNWLLTEYSQSNFQNLFRKSTPLDYEEHFKSIYEIDFTSALGNYIDFLRAYQPREGELIYYASLYRDHGDFKRAGELYETLSAVAGNKIDALDNLAACRLWNGEFSRALTTYDSLLTISPDTGHYLMLKGDALMALGEFEKGYELYEKAFLDHKNGLSGLRLVELLIDKENIDSARTVFGKLDANVRSRLSYLREAARLKIASGDSGHDTTLNQAAAMAANIMLTAPDDPRGYLAAGRSFALLGQFERAKASLKTAIFLERRQSFHGLHLLELGKAADLEGDRDEAVEYYRRGAQSGAGEYIKMLCEKYADTPYRSGN